MKRSIMAMVAATMICATGGAVIEWFESVYRNDKVNALGDTQAFTLAYTNNTGYRMAIASLFAKSLLATGTWAVAVVNNNQTNNLVAGTALTYASNGIKYDGTANVPLGNGGIIQLTGTVATNVGGTTVQWQIHFK